MFEAMNSQLQQVLSQWQAMQPLSERDQMRLSQRFTVDFNYNSNHIEGNTLTYGQTELLLMFDQVVQTARMRDLEEMKASNVGLLMMKQEASVGDYPLTGTFIRQLHKTLLRQDYEEHRTLPGGAYTSFTIHAGQYKTRPNSVITRYGDRFEYASPEETPALMTDLVNWYNETEREGSMHPVELATLFHYRYIRIHPFEDGNGRIARLLVNYILSRHGYPMVVVRSRKKKEYLEALHQADLRVGPVPSDGAHATLEQIKPFHSYFTRLVTSEIKFTIDFLTAREQTTWWFDGERITFNSPTVGNILQAMHDNPDVTVTQLAETAGVSRTAVQKTVKSLVDKGYVLQNADILGRWHVVIACSLWG